MAKVTSKLQVSIPKAIADHYGIRPGQDIAFEPAGAVIRLVPARPVRRVLAPAEVLRLFDEGTKRQLARQRKQPVKPAKSRGWTREDAYRERLDRHR